MGINRRRGNRRTFKFNKNYIIPFICIVITCTTVIISTIIILNLQKQIPVDLNMPANGLISKVELQDNEILQINNMFSFLMSNLDIGQEISNENMRYMLACKFYAKDNAFKVIEDENIDDISPDIYRELGYAYFTDYKDTYMYISKTEYVNAYMKLFDKENLNAIEQYYIPELDGYVAPKNNYIYDNSKYKLSDIQYNSEDNIYIATLLEVNVLKLYEQKEYTLVEEYLNNSIVDSNYLTGKMFKVKLKKVDNNFVFVEYTV